MSEKESIWRNLLDKGGLKEECVPGQSVVEIFGDHRVLIEHHSRIIEYDLQQISVGVCYGVLSIHGSNLRLRHLSQQKLLITGKIDRIDLQRGHHS